MHFFADLFFHRHLAKAILCEISNGGKKRNVTRQIEKTQFCKMTSIFLVTSYCSNVKLYDTALYQRIL